MDYDKYCNSFLLLLKIENENNLVHRNSTFLNILLNHKFNKNKIMDTMLDKLNPYKEINRMLNDFDTAKPDTYFTIENILLHSIIYKYNEELNEENKFKRRNFTNDNNFKYKTLFSFLDNPFLNSKTKNNLMNVISTFQNKYFALKKFINICKFKCTDVAIKQDMFFNDIDCNSKHVIKVYQNKKIYYFTVFDMIQIIENSLCNCMCTTFVVQPLQPKNPYNNIDFSIETFYALYSHIRYNMVLKIPLLLELWKRESFEKSILFLKYEKIIRKIAIKKFVWNTTESYFYEDIRDMLIENLYTRKWEISKDFPNKILQQIFKHHIYLYYIINYECTEETEACLYETYLRDELKKCYFSNPSFGTKKEISCGFKNEIKICFETTLTTSFNCKDF